MNVHQVSTRIGDREFTIETGKLAKQADGSVIVKYGDTVLLVTACAAKQAREGLDFFPLTVDYRENFYAAGKIPGGFFKREGKPSEREVLNSRLIDRPIRPLFAEGFKNETQVVALVLSADTDIDPSMHAITGASTALYLSTIPFSTPIAAVRVGLIDGRYYLNPTYSEMKNSRLNLAIAGMEDGIAMVECGANEVSEEVMVEALNFGHEAVKQIIALQKELYAKINPKKIAVTPPLMDEVMTKHIEQAVRADLEDALDTHKHPKLQSYELVDAAKKKAVELFPEADEDKVKMVKRIFDSMKERIFRDEILKKRERPDRRGFETIRPIWIETGMLPRTHGSAVFTRGETQALVTTTLGTADDAQRMDWLEGEAHKRFLMHYNFPPFSVGEVSPLRGPGRREVGHGALAERALLPVIPGEEDFPYTIRVVSDILESNGSSSMATVCGGSLALMDAGVPIKAPVAGIAMGLVKEGANYGILTDIAGAEDHYGDMDFKVAGTRDGITALQMDIKIPGVTAKIMAEALDQAKRGRLFILDKMQDAIAEVRPEMSIYAPRIYSMKIPTDKIRDVIGPGGKMIRSIIDQTGVKIDVSDDGRVNIASSDGPSAQKAIQIISDLTATAEIGKIYLGKVVRIADFGAFVELFPGTDGLLHISEIAEERIRNVRDILKEGDQVSVKVVGIEGNKIKLSRRAVLRDHKQKQEQQK
jgi:polyribonucleotide nucleotidyltransferase